jgi:DNA-binding transcriptional LysR family regulator
VGSGPVGSRPAIPREQLAGASFFDFPPGWGNRAVADRAFAAAGLDRQVPFEAADFAAAAGLIRHGLGIAFLPASVAAAQPGMGTIELSGPPLIWSIFVATPLHRRTSAAARAFLRELAAGGR